MDYFKSSKGDNCVTSRQHIDNNSEVATYIDQLKFIFCPLDVSLNKYLPKILYMDRK